MTIIIIIIIPEKDIITISSYCQIIEAVKPLLVVVQNSSFFLFHYYESFHFWNFMFDVSGAPYVEILSL